MKADDQSLVRVFDIQRVDKGHAGHTIDSVAVEEPLEIRLSYWFKDARVSEPLAITMRTPGHDIELAAGFLLSEGIIHSSDDLVEIRALGISPSNEVTAELKKGIDVERWRLARSTLLSSSCGICGKRVREAIPGISVQRPCDDLRWPSELIGRLPDLLQRRQTGFAQTGGLHAAALVNAKGEVEAAFEDIGRHNALDKLLGDCLLRGRVPLQNQILFLSSRSSFELIQKAATAGASVLATVGGPSSLAIEAARDCGITLIGFVRAGRFNIYSAEWRIKA